MRPRLRRWLGAFLLLSGLAFALTGALWRGLPDPRPLRDPAWVMRRFGLTAWTPLAQVSPLALRAVLLSEDDSFFEHDGLRMDEWPSAAWDDLLNLRYKRGASSITQQVVRNAFLDKDKALSRKAVELLLARKADGLVGKRRLLEDYINLAEWGSRGERGIAAAASGHFGKAPGQLNAAEGALLSWLLPQPRLRGRRLDQGDLSMRARRHLRRILARLVREGGLSEDDAAAQAQALVDFERRAAQAGRSGTGGAP